MDNIYSQMLYQGKSLFSANFKRENVMEDFIQGNPNILKLDANDKVLILDSQVKFPKKTSDGRIDLLISYNKETLAVAELKRGVLTESDYKQLKDYFEKDETLDKIAKSVEGQVGGVIKDWIGVLVGSAVSPELLSLLRNEVELKSGIPFVVVALKRFRFAGEEGCVSEVYKGTKTVRSRKQYILDDGDPLPLKRFVLNVFRSYVNKNPSASYSTLQTYFSSFRYSVTSSVLKEFFKTEDYKGNYFTEDGELLKMSDGRVYTLRCFWYAEEDDVFIKVAEDLGYKVQVINK